MHRKINSKNPVILVHQHYRGNIAYSFNSMNELITFMYNSYSYSPIRLRNDLLYYKRYNRHAELVGTEIDKMYHMWKHSYRCLRPTIFDCLVSLKDYNGREINIWTEILPLLLTKTTNDKEHNSYVDSYRKLPEDGSGRGNKNPHYKTVPLQPNIFKEYEKLKFERDECEYKIHGRFDKEDWGDRTDWDYGTYTGDKVRRNWKTRRKHQWKEKNT